MSQKDKCPIPAAWPADGFETLGHCPVCGEKSRQRLYDNLTDRLFGAPGHWTMYRCNGCKCGYLDPRPNEATIGLAYERYITHEPEPIAISSGASKIKRLRMMIRNSYLNRKYGYHFEPSTSWGHIVMYLLPPPLRLEWDHYARHLSTPLPGLDRLLDIGCGNGSFLARARQLGWKVQGLEFDHQAAAIARSQGIEVWVGDYRQTPFGPETFDAITCHQVLEHIHDVHLFMRHLTSWLKADGRLWLGTPNFGSISRMMFGNNWRDLHPPQHLTLFTPSTLSKLLSECGMKGHLVRRGYCEAHIATESESLRQGYVGQKNISQHKHLMRCRSRNVLLEFLAWLLPEKGGDLVIIAHKSR